MRPADYLKKAEKVTIKVNGTGQDSKPIQLVSEKTVATKRPLLDRLLSICSGDKTGIVEFTDRACFSGTAIKVDNVELWYSDVLIGKRIIPDILMGSSDSLEVTWSLTIDRYSGKFLGWHLHI